MQNIDDEKARLREEVKKRVEQGKAMAGEISYQKFRIGNILAMVAGVIFLCVAGYFAWRDKSSTSARTAVKGTVTGFETAWTRKNNNRDSSEISRPIIQYTYDGQSRTVKGSTGAGASVQPYTEGEAITILVDPANPEDVIIDTFSERYLPMAGAGILGIFLLGLGARRHFLAK